MHDEGVDKRLRQGFGYGGVNLSRLDSGRAWTVFPFYVWTRHMQPRKIVKHRSLESLSTEWR
jgi:hypothetical protein